MSQISKSFARAGVVVSGPDARAFLHRMSSQHVEALTAGQGVLNCLTNDKGRLVDLVHHMALEDDRVFLVGHRTDSLAEWLDGFVFSEDLELEDKAVEARWVTGPAAPEKWGFEGALIRSFDLVMDGKAVPSWLSLEPVNGEELDDQVWEDARIAAGVPRAPGELCDKYNPLELGLHDAIHWAKGCYIGQEVISRIDNYGKQSRQLVGLRGPAKPGDEVLNDGKKIGTVTSATSPRVDDWPNALAVIKFRGDPEGTELIAGDAPVRVTQRHAAQAPHD